MSKIHENAGIFSLMQGNKAYIDKDFSQAEKSLKDAVLKFSQAEKSDVVIANLEKAYINLSASLVAQSKLDKAISFLTEAENIGYKSAEFRKNFAVAYYNLGLQQKATNLDAAILSFTKAKSYKPDDATILYNLALAFLKKGEYAQAKTEFSTLLDKKFGKDELPLELQMNSYCKLIECQLALHEEIDCVLESASQIFSALDAEAQVKHQEEGIFIYSHLIAGYLTKQNNENVTSALSIIATNVKEIAQKIVLNLEQYALHLYSNSNQKVAMTMLLTLAHAKSEIIDATFLETIKADLVAMSHKLDKGTQSDAFALKVLGDIEHCDYDAISELFT